MKVGFSKNIKAYYAAEYSHATNKVEIVDTDKNLDTLLERIGWISKDEDETKNQNSSSTNDKPNC